MFDNTHHHHHSTSVNVTEKRAPTDESVRLLSEMQKAAQDQIIKTIRLESNILNATCHSMRDHMNLDNRFMVLLELNGKRIKVEAYTDSSKSIEEQMRTIYDAIAYRIAETIMPKVFTDSKQLFGIL